MNNNFHSILTPIKPEISTSLLLQRKLSKAFASWSTYRKYYLGTIILHNMQQTSVMAKLPKLIHWFRLLLQLIQVLLMRIHMLISHIRSNNLCWRSWRRRILIFGYLHRNRKVWLNSLPLYFYPNVLCSSLLPFLLSLACIIWYLWSGRLYWSTNIILLLRSSCKWVIQLLHNSYITVKR